MKHLKNQNILSFLEVRFVFLNRNYYLNFFNRSIQKDGVVSSDFYEQVDLNLFPFLILNISVRIQFTLRI